ERSPPAADRNQATGATMAGRSAGRGDQRQQLGEDVVVGAAGVAAGPGGMLAFLPPRGGGAAPPAPGPKPRRGRVLGSGEQRPAATHPWAPCPRRTALGGSAPEPPGYLKKVMRAGFRPPSADSCKMG